MRACASIGTFKVQLRRQLGRLSIHPCFVAGTYLSNYKLACGRKGTKFHVKVKVFL